MKFVNRKLYLIEFHDHHIGKMDIKPCKMVGWFHEKRDDFVIFLSWITIDKHNELDLDNCEEVALVESCIINKTRLD